MNITSLSLSDLCNFSAIGFALAIVYLLLVWQTLTIARSTKRKILILFLSSTLRIFLIIFVSLVFAKENPLHFLIIIGSFLITRNVLLRIFSPSLKKKMKSHEILYADDKKTPANSKQTKRKR